MRVWDFIISNDLTQFPYSILLVHCFRCYFSMTVNCSIYISKHRTLSFPTGSRGNPNGNGQIVTAVDFEGFLFFSFFGILPDFFTSLWFLWNHVYSSCCHGTLIMNLIIISLKTKYICIYILSSIYIYIEHLYAFHSFSDETSKSYLILQTDNSALQGSLQAFISAVPCPGDTPQPSPSLKTSLAYHFLRKACQRTSTFAFITLHCNCLFTHLFPQVDSELPEVGNLVLFNFAASCWLQGRPEL